MGPSTALAAPTHGAVAAAEHSQDDASTSNLAKGRTRVSPLHGGSGNDTLQCFARSIMQLGVPQTQGSGGGGAGPGHGQGDKNRSRPRQHGGTQRPTPEGGQQPRAGIPAPRMQGVNAAGGAAGVPRDASLAPSSAEEGPAKKPRRKRAGGRGDGQGKAGGSVGGEEPMSGVAPHAQVPARAVHRVTAGAGAAGAVDPPLPPKAVVDQTFMTSTTFRSLGLHPATQQVRACRRLAPQCVCTQLLVVTVT